MSRSSIKVLLVEDDSQVAELIMMLLSFTNPHNYEVEWVDCLKSGINIAQKRNPDIILLDLGLPDSQGLDTFKRVHNKALNIPVVILTGFEDTSIALESIKLGAQDYLDNTRLNKYMLDRVISYSLERHHLQLKSSKYAAELMESEKRLRLIIEKNVDAIIITDMNSNVQFINPAAETFLGRKRSDLLYESFGFPVIGGKITEIDIIHPKTKTHLIAEMRVVNINWEGKQRCLASLRDITERKAVEKKLIISERKLKDALKELQENQDKILELESMKNIQQLSGAISHEISQPLQVLSNYIGLIEYQGPKPKYIVKCKNAINIISVLIHDLEELKALKRKDYLNTQIIDLKASTFPKDVETGKYKILLVDDEKDILDSLLEFLKLSGYDCEGANDGFEALEYTKSREYQLIISDIMMPNMTGPQFFNELKSKGYNAFFIFLTGYKIPDDVRKMVMKADAIINKPVDFQDLLEIVEKIIGKIEKEGVH